MNQDARDENSPTGQALGTIALITAGTATVAGGLYATKTIVGKSAKAVKNKVLDVAADVEYEKRVFREAGTELGTGDALKMRSQRRVQKKVDDFNKKRDEIIREKYGAKYAPTDDEIKQDIMDNMNKYTAEKEQARNHNSRIADTASPSRPDPHDPGPSYEKDTTGKFNRPGTSKSMDAEGEKQPVSTKHIPTTKPVGDVEGFANSKANIVDNNILEMDGYNVGEPKVTNNLSNTGNKIHKTNPDQFFKGDVTVNNTPKSTAGNPAVNEDRTQVDAAWQAKQDWAKANTNKTPSGTSSGKQFVGNDANGNPIYV